MPTQPWKVAWGGIDDTAEPGAFVETMDLYRGEDDDNPAYYPFFPYLNAKEGSRILDVGCGLGGAVRALAPRVGATGRVIGVDRSRTMINTARERAALLELPIDFQVADGHLLPFADATFSGAFSVATIELIADPERALAELIRVTQPGGRVVVNATDFGSWILDASDALLTDRILRFARDRQTNGLIGRQLRRLFVENGLKDVLLILRGAAFTDFEFYWQIWLGPWLADAITQGVVTPAEADSWHRDLQSRAAAHLFLLAAMEFTVIGTR